MASDSRALWDDSDWLSSPVVWDRRGRRVLGALAGAPLCSSQCGGKKKMKQQRRLLFAPYLVPLTPSLWTFLLKGVEGGGAGRRRGRSSRKKKRFWGKKSWREKTTRDSSVWCLMLFFPGGLCGLLRGFSSSNDSVFACAHGDCECLRLDACAGFTERMELALWNCEWMTRRVAGGKGECLLWSHWGWMQGFCLCCLSLCRLFERGFPAGEGERERAPSLPGGGTTASYLKHGRLCLF